MYANNMGSKVISIFILVLLSGCAVVERVHVYFNKQPVKLVSAKRTEYFEVVANNTAKLSDITYKLTGTRSTAAVRAANPNMRSDVLIPGMVLRIPTKLLKPGMRSQSKYIQREPLREPGRMPEAEPKTNKKPNEVKESKRINKITLPGSKEGVEILPGDNFEPEDENYDNTPFKRESGDVIPYVPPKPTPDKQQAEEEILRDKYKDIMRQLE